MLQQP